MIIFNVEKITRIEVKHVNKWFKLCLAELLFGALVSDYWPRVVTRKCLDLLITNFRTQLSNYIVFLSKYI